MSVLPPATLEGWYALHQVFALDWAALHGLDATVRERLVADARELLGELAQPGVPGWSAFYQLVGGGADTLFIHFRETPEALADAQLRIRRSALGPYLRVEYDYTSVTEAGLYQPTAEAASQAEPYSPEFNRIIEEAAAAERASPHVQSRLYPKIPEGMRYVSFYPMSKRRVHPDNWYTLPVDERNRLMREHGLTGRRFAKKIYQVITGSVGLDDWEWGVTLFAHDLLDVKRVVTDMRFDEASSRFGEFGSFYVGILLSPEEWVEKFLGA